MSTRTAIEFVYKQILPDGSTWTSEPHKARDPQEVNRGVLAGYTGGGMKRWAETTHGGNLIAGIDERGKMMVDLENMNLFWSVFVDQETKAAADAIGELVDAGNELAIQVVALLTVADQMPAVAKIPVGMRANFERFLNRYRIALEQVTPKK